MYIYIYVHIYFRVFIQFLHMQLPSTPKKSLQISCLQDSTFESHRDLNRCRELRGTASHFQQRKIPFSFTFYCNKHYVNISYSIYLDIYTILIDSKKNPIQIHFLLYKHYNNISYNIYTYMCRYAIFINYVDTPHYIYIILEFRKIQSNPPQTPKPGLVNFHLASVYHMT